MSFAERKLLGRHETKTHCWQVAPMADPDAYKDLAKECCTCSLMLESRSKRFLYIARLLGFISLRSRSR